jgi:hypothetical protein
MLERIFKMNKLFVVAAFLSVYSIGCTPGIRNGSNSHLTQEQRMQEVKEQYTIVQNKISNHEISFAGGDGSTIENAIIITGAKTDKESVISEQVYFMNRFGIKGQDWQMISQAEIENKGKMYDLMQIIKLKDNKNESYYFDISCCFGKY